MTSVPQRMRKAADTLEVQAEAMQPLDPFEMVRLAVDLRDWAMEIELERASGTNVVVLERPRFPGER